MIPAFPTRSNFLSMVVLVMLRFSSADWANCRPQHLIIIGLDGVGSQYLKGRLDNLPNIAMLYAGGASTLRGQAFAPVLSLPNWSSLLLGANPTTTNITSNQGEEFNTERFPSMFDAAEASGISTDLFSDWRPIFDVLNKGDIDSAMGSTESIIEDFCSKLQSLAASSSKRMSFVHIDNVDEAGHKYQYGSEEYFKELEKADLYVGRILLASKHLDPLYFLVSDHGGTATQHGVNTKTFGLERQVPIIAYGSGVIQRSLHWKNLADVAATALDALGVSIPDTFTGNSALKDILTSCSTLTESDQIEFERSLGIAEKNSQSSSSHRGTITVSLLGFSLVMFAA